MVTFNTYQGPMDRKYDGESRVDDNSTNDLNVSVKDIGQSVPLGIAAANVQGIAAKIRQGASAMEIQFPGAMRGQRGAHTPGMYGDDQREAIRELAKINEVNLTTHASFGIMGLAGMDQQGNFSSEQRKLAVDEIKRAIEFAADTAEGGSVVVHTGEFQRPISEIEWARDEKGNYLFKQYAEEDEQAIIRVVDRRTGRVMDQVRKNQEVARPVWNRYNSETNSYLWNQRQGNSYIDDNGNEVKPGDYIDHQGNLVTDMGARVASFDHDTGRFRVQTMKWQDFEEEAEKRNRRRERELGRPLTEDEKILPEEAYIRASLETSREHSKGWALQYAQGFDREKKHLDELKKAYKVWKQIEDASSEDEKELLKKPQSLSRLSEYGITAREHKLPTELIDEEMDQIRKRMEYEQQASSSQQQQALLADLNIQNAVSAKKYALEKSYDSYADAGIYAMNITKQKHLEERPLMVTMENIFPESYGGHPQELKNLILKSREVMADKLKQQGYAESEAKKAAETHLKATLDTGHVNIWRKYWQNDSKKSMSENDSNFKKWFLDQVEDLAKHQIVGNVHLTDNYGYHDDHLSPGQGTTPVKEAVAILKKHGYKGAMSVEPGADASTDQGDFWGLMKTWKLFGSPVYGAHVGSRLDVPKRTWSDIQYSHFGQTQSPYFIFGSYAPSQDWSLWSQTPLE